MLQPVTRAWALGVLLVLTTAEAQPQVARGRRVTIAASPGEPLPEVRGAAGSVTVIVMDAPVDKTSVQVDSTRIRLVDVELFTLELRDESGSSRKVVDVKIPPAARGERSVP